MKRRSTYFAPTKCCCAHNDTKGLPCLLELGVNTFASSLPRRCEQSFAPSDHRCRDLKTSACGLVSRLGHNLYHDSSQHDEARSFCGSKHQRGQEDTENRRNPSAKFVHPKRRPPQRLLRDIPTQTKSPNLHKTPSACSLRKYLSLPLEGNT